MQHSASTRISKIARGRMRGTGRREHKFVTGVFYVGIALVLTFVLWTFAMVFLQAVDQWHK
jgi:hypothetical protein